MVRRLRSQVDRATPIHNSVALSKLAVDADGHESPTASNNLGDLHTEHRQGELSDAKNTTRTTHVLSVTPTLET